MEAKKVINRKSLPIHAKGFLSSWVLEMCLLSLLNRNDNYGYELSRIICFDVSESTLYPVLRRLEASEYLSSHSDMQNSKLRKVYSITVKGVERLANLKSEWNSFTDKISCLLGTSD
jgi:PadR family transcriptional regulator PadR